MNRFWRRAASGLVLAGLCLAAAACSVVSAISPQAYMDNVSVKSINLSALPVGTYSGDYTLALPPDVYAVNRHFNVTVAIVSAASVAVTLNDPTSLASNTDFQAMIGRITASKAIPVDGVSGATYSSRALLKAVEKAVAP